MAFVDRKFIIVLFLKIISEASTGDICPHKKDGTVDYQAKTKFVCESGCCGNTCCTKPSYNTETVKIVVGVSLGVAATCAVIVGIYCIFCSKLNDGNRIHNIRNKFNVRLVNS